MGTSRQSPLLQYMKGLVPPRLKQAIRGLTRDCRYRPVLSQLRTPSEAGRFILMATPEHGNLGDHAIATAEHDFLADAFPEKEVCEITGDCYRALKAKIVPLVRHEDVLFITGGGFLGSLWMNEEELVRDIIVSFPGNRIVVFPQTVFFEENEEGALQLQISSEIFGRHGGILVAVRDKASAATAAKILGINGSNRVLYVPDMATYLEKSKDGADGDTSRTGILACLRMDKEKVRNESVLSIIEEIARNRRCSVKVTDTVVSRPVGTNERSRCLEGKLVEFREAELVVTDRLHGMLFAAITATPCIALDNLSGKVSGVYEWLQPLGYVKMAKAPGDLFKLEKELAPGKAYAYDRSLLLPAFEEFARQIRLFIHTEAKTNLGKGSPGGETAWN